MTTLEALKYTDRDLIESIVANFFILDYGYVSKVNDDGTVNVCHAKKMQTIDGVEMPAMYTDNVEVLTWAGSEFSMQFDIKQGDKVLLLGLKNWVETVGKVEEPTSQEAFLHYSRETLKALPMCTFNGDAKVTVNVGDGTASIMAQTEIDINGTECGGIVDWPKLQTQLGYMKTRIDTIINALTNAVPTAQDGGQALQKGIVGILNGIENTEDFSGLENTTVKHGKRTATAEG